ncbi:hypothetical protein NMY22_g5832 [Coprinellus aureogranulatus]|nr:hypothetical protein NMY22_g5832 [Coprinellus aureogranulatus]
MPAHSDRSHPEANLFSGSSNPSFRDSNFNAAAHDIINPTFSPTFSHTVNVHVRAPLIGSSDAPPPIVSPKSLARGASEPSSEARPEQYRKSRFRLFKQIFSPRSRAPEGLVVPSGASSDDSYSTDEACSQQISDSDDVTLPVTPNASCSPSPPSSSSESRISSVEDIDPHLFTSRYLTTPQVYVRSMINTGKGLACWQPQPRSSASGFGQGTAPGDVGTSSPEGGFRKIFNIWDEGACLQSLPPRKLMRVPEELPRGHIISEGASSETMFGFEGRYVSSFEFRCKSDSGAFLVATSGAEAEELEDCTKLRNWIVRNAERLYRHANDIREIAQDEPLYIVTGCVKSDSWALGAFRKPAHMDEPMSLQVVAQESDGRPRYAWTRTWSSSEAQVGSSCVAGLKDQALFLRGFKLDFSVSFRDRMEAAQLPPTGAPPGNGSPDDSDNSRSTGDQDGPGSTGPLGGKYGSPSGKGHQQGAACEPADEWVGSGPFPRVESNGSIRGSFCSSFAHDTGAEFALCHDDEWRFALEGLDVAMDVLGKDRETHVMNGVALLSQRNAGGEYGGPCGKHMAPTTVTTRCTSLKVSQSSLEFSRPPLVASEYSSESESKPPGYISKQLVPIRTIRKTEPSPPRPCIQELGPANKPALAYRVQIGVYPPMFSHIDPSLHMQTPSFTAKEVVPPIRIGKPRARYLADSRHEDIKVAQGGQTSVVGEKLLTGKSLYAGVLKVDPLCVPSEGEGTEKGFSAAQIFYVSAMNA